ncbi:unnamed protein product [Acanthocheilonema viteae]|uniref:Uncharacterized protein n=1 Tax=Acanthocheilonema viteae TaxID=6277 RepID=A0A498SPQ7_ACAVI|nr:unnamed protein product [Acanthocheilonema viteae]
MPLMRRRWLSFSRFAMRPRNYGNGQQQQQPQQCRKRKTKKYYPGYTNVMQMECAGKRRKKDLQMFTTLSNNATLQRNVPFDLPRTVYLMRVLDNLRHQKPVKNDEEGTSEENTTQETFDTEEKMLPINDMQTATKHFSYAQSPSTNQHTSIPPFVPPPPIVFANLQPPNDDEALASMLMSCKSIMTTADCVVIRVGLEWLMYAHQYFDIYSKSPVKCLEVYSVTSNMN